MTRADRVATIVLVLLLCIRVSIALWLAPVPVEDASGYDVSAQRLLVVGSFAYPFKMPGRPAEVDYWQGSTIAEGRSISVDGTRRFFEAPPNAYVMPGFSAFVAAVYRVSGQGRSGRWIGIRIAQAILSCLAALVVYIMARRYGERVSLIALGAMVLYLPFSAANSLILTEVLYSFLLVVFAASLLRWIDRPDWKRATACAAFFAATLWVRPSLALWAPLGVALLVFRKSEDRPRMLRSILWMGFVVLLLISPWWVRNYRLYKQPVLFSTSGANPLLVSYYNDIGQPQRVAESEMTAQGAPDDLALDHLWAVESHRLWQREIATDPLRVVSRRVHRVGVSLLLPYTYWMYPMPIGSALQLFHVVLLGLFLAGAASAVRRTELLLLASLPAYFVILHAVILPDERYYFPSAPLAIIVAAVGLDSLVAHVLASRASRAGLPTRQPIQRLTRRPRARPEDERADKTGEV